MGTRPSACPHFVTRLCDAVEIDALSPLMSAGASSLSSVVFPDVRTSAAAVEKHELAVRETESGREGITWKRRGSE